MSLSTIKSSGHVPEIGYIKRIFPFILSFLLLGGLFSLFWPGYMSPDSVSQLNQGLKGVYSDAHPPMMSFFWRLLSYVYNGTEAYLIFHFVLFLSAVLILQSSVKQIWLRYVIAFIPLFPSLSAYSGALWKDVGFAFSFLLAASILASANIQQHRLTFIKGFCGFGAPYLWCGC
jgi:hypothetical protein